MGSLYRKYRSRSLDEIVGQEHITKLLSRTIAAGTIAHGYLLTGPHGVGKTSIARILAHEINQLPYLDETNHLDIVEIDAASNNGVEDIRDLRERVRIAPGNVPKKVYIIDEVHMLSKSAFNALLKTLEEPPEHVVFILATTEPDKLPSTILSRVQRFNFRAIEQSAIVTHLRSIAERENIAIDDQALERVAEHGQGSFRDSISVLDQLRHVAPGEIISVSDVESTLGATDSQTIETILDATRKGQLSQLVTVLKSVEDQGIGAQQVTRQIATAIRADIVTHPEEIGLLDQLLEVAASSYPHLKLLTVLAKFAPVSQPDQKSASQPKPVAAPQPVPSSNQPTKKLDATITSVADAPVVDSPQLQTQQVTPTKNIAQPPLVADFSWNDFLIAAKKQSGALSALLNKSEADYLDGVITIYAGTAFAVKKLESAKLRPFLSEIAEAQGISGDSIVLKASKKPPSNTEAAAIAAIMGGGEEVDVNGN